MSPTNLAPAFLIALVFILLACRAVGAILRYAGQPPVVGEMVTGVVLGPSVLGALCPGFEHAIFPAAVRPVLYVLGQVGLVVFMFGCGLEFPSTRLRKLAPSASVISGVGVAVPLLLGICATVLARGHVALRPAGVSFMVAALFVGVTLAITAFPMLARLITERGLSESRFGSVALACGALDDVVAWLLLAVVLSLAGGSAGPALRAGGGIVAMFIVLILMTKYTGRLGRLIELLPTEHLMLVMVSALFLSAWFTDKIGLYAVFGAFSLGVAVPRTPALYKAYALLQPIGAVFLPLFFTYSGLNTDFGLLFHPALMIFTAGVLAAAFVGKFVACWFGARLVGEPQPVALRIGTLMNARGLMQLIAVNVGLAAGIITHELFSVLVVVALVTTVAASPLLSLWDRRDARRGVGSDGELLLLDETAVVDEPIV